MNWDDVYLVSENLNQASDADVDALEAFLAVKMPEGYRTYVKSFGEGDYCGFLGLYSPQFIQTNLKKVRERWEEYYFWEQGKDKLAKAQVLESIIFASTIDGDEFIFHPSNPRKIYVLPRNDEDIFLVGSSIDELTDWLFESGELYQAYTGFHFIESYVNRAQIRFIKQGIINGFYETLTKEFLQFDHQHREEQSEEINFYVKAFWGECSISAKHSEFYVGYLDYDIDKGLHNPSLTSYITKFLELGFSFQTTSENKEMQQWLTQLKNNAI